MPGRGNQLRGWISAGGSCTMGAIPVVLAPYGAIAAAVAPAAAASSTAGGSEQLSLSMIFTAFLVMLGPFKIIGPFAALTAGVEEAAARRIALKAIGIACLAGVVAAIAGQRVLVSWRIAPPSLYLTTGIILLLVALYNVLAQYDIFAGKPKPAGAPADIAFVPLAFPTIVTPYGIAAFILVLAVSRDVARDLTIVGLFLAVMLLNLLVMWYARPIVRHGGFVLQLLGAILGVLQVALGVQLIVNALRALAALRP
jgi:multiple antibiotic resistance protein